MNLPLPYVYDTGVLLAVERDDRRMLSIHRLAIDDLRQLVVPTVVVAQVWRDGRRQAKLARFLETCEIRGVGIEVAKAAGVICGKAGTRDAVDAIVATMALVLGATVFTSDPDDIKRLGAASGGRRGLVVRRV